MDNTVGTLVAPGSLPVEEMIDVPVPDQSTPVPMAEVEDKGCSSLSIQAQLFEAHQSMIIVTLLPKISAYVSQKTGQVVTVEELTTHCLKAPSELTVGIVVQSTKAESVKKNDRDPVGGCQRILGERVHDVAKRGQPCGETVWKNASGQKAFFCAKCMRLKTFEKQVAPLVASWSMTFAQATAGNSNALKNSSPQQAGTPTAFTPVMPPGWQNSPPQNHVYQQEAIQYPGPSQAQTQVPPRAQMPPQTQVSPQTQVQTMVPPQAQAQTQTVIPRRRILTSQ